MIGMLTARASVVRDVVDRLADCAGRPRSLDRARYRASVQPDVIGAASVCARARIRSRETHADSHSCRMGNHDGFSCS
ncbi:hypothetical protein A3768_4304 (plasmid) [Ralstonia solanacearum]|nr:hypothetical protein A3768_4304 [Ralstonia solanacearum]ARU24368.1 NADPH-dependent FMN reductase [Ralstonia solanacearum]